jgi:uncharacterized protein
MGGSLSGSQQQALHAEVGQRGVRVQAMLPGGTRTEVWERSGIHLSRLPPERPMGVDEMVDAEAFAADPKGIQALLSTFLPTPGLIRSDRRLA